MLTIHDNKIISLAKKLEFEDIIVGKDLNLNTKLYEKGGNLSGGQAQKISILRALVCDPSIIILDEVDTFLDEETKYNIENYINNENDKIFFIISHDNIENIKITKTINL